MHSCMQCQSLSEKMGDSAGRPATGGDLGHHPPPCLFEVARGAGCITTIAAPRNMFSRYAAGMHLLRGCTRLLRPSDLIRGAFASAP